MFGTLHLNSRTREAEYIERPHGSSDPEKNSACDRCRAKKVKCSTNYDGCTRCKRLGKSCTFSSTRKGDQRIRKAATNLAHQEHSLDFFIRSSPSLGSRDNVLEDEECPAKQRLATSRSANPNEDDNEQEQEWLATPQSEGLADNSTCFDLSFLAEFNHQTSDQDSDGISNHALSPWPPLLSTILPNTHHGTIQSTTNRDSESLLSPSLSPGGDISNLTSACRSHGSPCLDSTPPSLDRSTLASTKVESQKPYGRSCPCLAAVVFAVEEFEASCNSGNRAVLDSIIAHQKEAINRCRSMLRCSKCMDKRENLVLLVFMTERIVTACARIAVLYRLKDGSSRGISQASSLLGRSPAENHSRSPNDVGGLDLDASASPVSSKTGCTPQSGPSCISKRTDSVSSDWQELLLGDYEISSSLEWEHLVRVLILLQFRAVMELVADIKSMGSKVLGDTQMASLTQAELRVEELGKGIYIV